MKKSQAKFTPDDLAKMTIPELLELLNDITEEIEIRVMELV